MKSDKNIVRDILEAQGLPNVEPTEEAVDVLYSYGYARWSAGWEEGWEYASE